MSNWLTRLRLFVEPRPSRSCDRCSLTRAGSEADGLLRIRTLSSSPHVYCIQNMVFARLLHSRCYISTLKVGYFSPEGKSWLKK
jgi:hypothetical protein